MLRTCTSLLFQSVPLLERLRAPPRARSFVVTACPPSTPCSQQITCGNDNMITASFATQISNDNMRFASDGGTVVTGVAPDRQRQDARSSVGERVRRRTAKTLRPTHMRPPMAVPAPAENEEPPWPDLRNMEGQDGYDSAPVKRLVLHSTPCDSRATPTIQDPCKQKRHKSVRMERHKNAEMNKHNNVRMEREEQKGT